MAINAFIATYDFYKQQTVHIHLSSRINLKCPVLDQNHSDGSWMLLPPEQSRDRAMLELLNHQETMLPHLPQLCPMSWPDMQVTNHQPQLLSLSNCSPGDSFLLFLPQMRRSDHRRGFFNGRNLCLDIVTSDGTLVGTTGFREVKNLKWTWSQVKVMRKQGQLREGTAEWGAIIHKCHPWNSSLFFDQWPAIFKSELYKPDW